MKDLIKQILPTLDGKYMVQRIMLAVINFRQAFPLEAFITRVLLRQFCGLKSRRRATKQAESSHDASEEVSAV